MTEKPVGWADVGIGPYENIVSTAMECVRRKEYLCATRSARARVSGQRMAAQRRCESKTVDLSVWCAWQEGFRMGCAPGAEGFQNLGFGGVLWVLSAAVGRKYPAGGMTGGGGAEGDADCHTSDVGHWFAMTWF